MCSQLNENRAIRFVLVGREDPDSLDALTATELELLRESVTWLGHREDVREILALPKAKRTPKPASTIEDREAAEDAAELNEFRKLDKYLWRPVPSDEVRALAALAALATLAVSAVALKILEAPAAPAVSAVALAPQSRPVAAPGKYPAVPDRCPAGQRPRAARHQGRAYFAAGACQLLWLVDAVR